MLHNYKHIIWDWNGTLLNDTWLCMDTMNRVLEKRHLPLLTIERYQQVFRFPVREYYLDLGLDFSQDSFEALSVEFMNQYEARRLEPDLQPDARRVLAAIREAGIEQSILSAYPQDSLIRLVQHFGLAPLFQKVIGLGDIYAASKVELGRNWMQKLGHASADVVLIGDTVHDFEVAEAIGSACLLIADGHNSKARLEQCGAPVLNSLAELLESMMFQWGMRR